jgi:hypothetical protein
MSTEKCAGSSCTGSLPWGKPPWLPEAAYAAPPPPRTIMAVAATATSVFLSILFPLFVW